MQHASIHPQSGFAIRSQSAAAITCGEQGRTADMQQALAEWR